MKWTILGPSQAPSEKPTVQTRRGINQAAKQTLEKVQSKQTDLSHDSRGIAGPHRSQPAAEIRPLSLSEYSAEYIIWTGEARFTPGELQPCKKNTGISARLPADPPQV